MTVGFTVEKHVFGSFLHSFNNTRTFMLQIWELTRSKPAVHPKSLIFIHKFSGIFCSNRTSWFTEIQQCLFTRFIFWTMIFPSLGQRHYWTLPRKSKKVHHFRMRIKGMLFFKGILPCRWVWSKCTSQHLMTADRLWCRGSWSAAV